MADEPFGNQNWLPNEAGGQNIPLSTGEGEAPLAAPPSPKIDLRTMASDLNSLKETGGAAPKPYTPQPTVSRPEAGTTPDISSFEPAKIGSVEAPAPFPTTLPKTKSKKGLFWGLAVLIIVLGLGAVGYFFIYPTFFAAPKTAETTTPPPVTVPAPQPQTPTVPETPAAAPTTSTATSTAIQNHASLFKTAADTTVDVNLATTDLKSLQAALPFNTADVPLLKEIVLRNAGNNILALNQIVTLFLGSDISTDVLGAFNSDLTAFVYTDKTGTWPGLVLAANPSANLAYLQSKISQQLEASAHLNNLFLTNPGAAGPTWKTGTTNGVSNRYLSFSTAGFALNYGWVGSSLLISTSYAGFKTAIQRLQ